MVITLTLTAALSVAAVPLPQGADTPPQGPFEILDLPQPEDIVLEVGGIAPTGEDLLVSTRRGEVWHIANAYSENPSYTLFADGLQEPLGLLELDGWFYTTQRGELSRMRDDDGDHRMDRLETLAEWPISGNYHEYAFGPTLAPDGYLWITLNKPFGPEPFGRVDWRGWAVRVPTPGSGLPVPATTSFEPVCAGLRSPAGVNTSPDGRVFYTDNQGEWCASSKFSLLEVGDFHGHPHGIESAKRPESSVAHPGDVPSGLRMADAAQQIPNFRLPVVWIPYDKLGRSPAGFVWDTDGNFGPYRGQVMVGDQYSSEVFRISMEEVGGRLQGACYPLQKGLKCGITRVAWGTDGSLWCGMTNRGWPSLGPAKHGLQRLRYVGTDGAGAQPFDLIEIRATARGYRLQYSMPVDPASVVAASFTAERYTYDHHKPYGCPPRDVTKVDVTGAYLADETTVEIELAEMVPTWVYALDGPGVRARSGGEPLHGRGWYTLNAIPE